LPANYYHALFWLSLLRRLHAHPPDLGAAVVAIPLTRLPDELRSALEAAFAAGRPAVIDCPMDYRENLRLTKELGHITCAL
jgi:hypothetical protein